MTYHYALDPEYQKLFSAAVAQMAKLTTARELGEQSKRTNADRLDAMTVEEKAEFLSELKYAPSCDSRCHKNIELYGEPRTCCEECWLNWLQEEVKE